MSDQFSFEEESHHLDWLKEASQFTDKHMYTHSEVSKDHFLEDMLQYDHQQHAANSGKDRPGHQRERSKVNSKSYRERKKGQVDHMRKQVEYLQKQNQFLKAQKQCRWCRKPFNPPVMYTKQKAGSIQVEKSTKYHLKDDPLEMQVQFQKPNFLRVKKEQRRGRIWMALGILMLVLGVTMYGFEGDKREVKEIEIYRGQMSRWSEQLKSDKQQYLQVKMRVKEERKSMLDPGELRILYRQGEPKESQGYEEEKVSINKQLLYGIHAQLEDIGLYL